MLQLFIYIFLLVPHQEPVTVEQLLKQKMDASTECWNQGNMECFMDTYWKSDSLLFIGGTRLTYGWENTLQNYKVGYPTSKERGTLSFTYKKIIKISSDAYFMVGAYHLKREAGDDNGHFSLLWRHIDNNWVIVADHSSN